jgi:transposase
VVENYIHLWQIERAFRISKTDLRIRPIYHYQKQRIEAHICIAFVAYTIYKELEYLLKKRGILMSSKRAAELTHNMYELEYNLPPSNVRKRQLLKMDREQQVLYDVIYK